MPFYLITGGNMRDGFFYEVEYYDNEDELKVSIEDNDISWKTKFEKVDTYFKFIYCHCDFDSDAELVIKETNEKYGNLIINEFPNQIPKNNDELNAFVNKINKNQREMYEDALDAWHESEINSFNSNENNSDWQQSYDDETSKWDRETGGSWRAENDFG